MVKTRIFRKYSIHYDFGKNIERNTSNLQGKLLFRLPMSPLVDSVCYNEPFRMHGLLWILDNDAAPTKHFNFDIFKPFIHWMGIFEFWIIVRSQGLTIKIVHH